MMQCHFKWIAVFLLIIHASLIAWSATKHSPNLNEPAHLIAGVSHWKYGRFELYRVNPPLIRMVAALPVLFSDAQYDWSGFYESPGARPVFKMGRQFIEANGEKSIWYFTIARWICIPFSLLGGYICYRWAKELYGSFAGLFSLTLWCFSPNMLAHGQFFTPDCGATALGITAAYFFWLWLRQPNWKRAIVSGLVLGLAELTKTTWIILFGLWPMIWLVWIFSRKGDLLMSGKRQIAQLSCVLILGIYLLNLGYGFTGSFTRLKEFQFVSHSLTGNEDNEQRKREDKRNRFVDSWIGEIPVPFPRNYILGIDVQKKDFENFGRESYLRGEFREKGWWYYYLYAMAIKVPIGYWIIFGLTVLNTIWGRSSDNSSWHDGFILAVPSLAVLTLVSSQTGLNHHMRYILPIFPFAFIWMGQSASWIVEKKKFTAILTGSSLVWAIGSSLFVYPHTLSYFNEIVGGPMNGHKHLINSNIDWGQDLLFLKEWIENNPEAKRIHICCYGDISPKDLGIDYELPPINANQHYEHQPPPGWYAISVNYLIGYSSKLPKDGFSYFQKIKPVATVGYSIYIYHIEY
tara:strand:+ start:1906 stop:3630 length:1725 start_codon:yes stop_codon:yes gene_type:complete